MGAQNFILEVKKIILRRKKCFLGGKHSILGVNKLILGVTKIDLGGQQLVTKQDQGTWLVPDPTNTSSGRERNETSMT